jgi:hypothetical protein
MKLLFLITLLVTYLCLNSAQKGPIAPGPFVLKPGIIRATITSLNLTILNIPRGGAIIQPLEPIDNTNLVTFTITITGQACDVFDPLVFSYRPLVVGGHPIVMSLPTGFFYYSTGCGGVQTAINLAHLERWVIVFRWDGQKFVNDVDLCPSLFVPSPGGGGLITKYRNY